MNSIIQIPIKSFRDIYYHFVGVGLLDAGFKPQNIVAEHIIRKNTTTQ